MTLTFQDSREGNSELVFSALRRLAGTKAKEAKQLRMFLPDRLTLETPHSVYNLGLRPIADGRGLQSAKHTAHRYLVSGPNGPLAAAEVRIGAHDLPTGVPTINFGPFVAATATAFAYLADLPQLRAGRFEAALLEFSAISLFSIWLKAANAEESLIHPLAPMPIEFSSEPLYSEPAFLAVARPLAEARLRYSDPEKTP